MRMSAEDAEQSIPERFEKVVRQYPNRLAVKMGGHALTYDELNDAANRLAHAIYSERGNRTEPVMLLTEQSMPAIIACLAIFKAGKILVLVDASFPAERVSLMVAESNAVGILTQSDSYAFARSIAKPSQFVIDIDALDGENRHDNLGLAIPPEAPAQIRFTSGSTGIPKGVVRSHRRVLHGNALTINGGRISSSDRMLVVRHLSFTQKDAFNGLLVGAAVYPYDIRKQGMSELAKIIVENRLTYFTSTPSFFRSFVNELEDTQTFPSVRFIQLGGEPLFKSEVESFKKRFAPGCVLMNQLSMNEAGTICQYPITHVTEISTALVPVGYPVEGKEVFVVDERRQNIGCRGVGEIAVKSRYLSSGYLGDPSLTDERYSCDSGVPGERIYYTGDFGQILPDGRVVYIGRRDDEVKIRGGKVRGSEVQAQLLGHPKIKNAVVMPRKNKNGELILIAYVVCEPDVRLPVEELNRFLSDKLPGFMVPARFVFLSSLPFTPGGKIDRMALPDPRTTRPDLKCPYVAPRNDIEKTVVTIWEEVLSVCPVGVNDNFFDLGGHSLAATRVISRIIKQLQLEIPLQFLFQSPTVAQMAEVINRHRDQTLSTVEMQATLTELESMSDQEAAQLVKASRRRDLKS